VERKLEWHQGPVVVICSLHCIDKGRSLHHTSPRTYPFVAELAVVREVYPWMVLIGERPVAVVAAQLCELVAEELRRREM
jgi:hypothetical protein